MTSTGEGRTLFLRQFSYLIAVAEEGHFGRAADRCCVTQPSLSSGIKQLELELGVTIFLRGRGQRFLGLTPEGECVSQIARQVLASCDAMKDELSRLKGNLKGKIRIGAMPSMSPVLPALISEFGKRHSGVKADVRFCGIDEMKSGLSNFSLDVGVTYLDQEDLGRLNTLPIFRQTLAILVPDVAGFAGKTSMTWQEAADLPLALLRGSMRERQFVNSIFAQVGRAPEPRVESESILHLMLQTQYSGLATVIPGHFAKMPGLQSGTRALVLKEPTVRQQVGLVWAEGEPTIPITGALVDLVKGLKKSGELLGVLGYPSDADDQTE